MADTKSTKYISKLQVGDADGADDTFIIKIKGQGGLGFPEVTEVERDAIWPPASFPNTAWRSATIYNSTIDRVQFNTGIGWITFDVGMPPSSIAAFYQQYSDDATYIVNHGAPTGGSVYFNTSLQTVRVFSNGNWYNETTPEPWQNNTTYVVGQIVWSGYQVFRCIINHTSSAGPATIYDDAVNWTNVGAHEIGQLDDVDTTGALAGDVLVRDVAGIYKPSAKGLFTTPLTIPVVAVEPATPAAGYVVLWADNKKTIKAKYEDGEVVEMIRQYDVVDFLDLGVLDASTVDNTAVAYLQVVATLAADVKAVQIFDTAGINLGWYDGSDVLLFVSGPGTNETTPVEIAAGTEIKVRPLEASATAFAGRYTVNFLG